MREDIAKRWTEALRSGSYQQIRGTLHTDEGFCCLGVLCDLYNEEYPHDSGWDEGSCPGRYQFQSEYEVLPAAVQAWAGMATERGQYDMDQAGPQTLAEANDGGLSFAEIAALIERHREDL